MCQSTPLYPCQVKRSFYFTAEDGTRLAADLIFPAEKAEEPASGPFPAVLIVSRGGRYTPETGNGDVFLNYLIPRGYVGAILESRGCGASYGTCDSFASLSDRRDAATFIEWLSAQPWCSGRVGMVGISNRAYIQLATATEQPPALKAITPTVAITDFYYQNYPNGVSAMPFLTNPAPPARMTKEEFLRKVTPVDEDPDGELAYQAYCQDQYGKNHFFVGHLIYANMNRDTENPHFEGEKTNLTLPPLTRRDRLVSSGIRQHQFIGQLESGTLGQLANYQAMGGSFTLGPWTHFQSRWGNPDVPEGMFPFNETYLAYMDAVLKDKDNGFLSAPPVTYYAFHAPDGEHWRCADSWPLEGERRAILYLSPEKSGTASSANDGSLTLEKPATSTGTPYQVDTSISVFDNHDGKGATYNRMTMCWDGDMGSDVDSKGLTFTSQPFFPMYENLLAGCVSVDLWVTSTARDGDFIAYLEEVLADGTSHFIKDGVIRASHRTAGKNEAWEAMGATWHTSMTEDVERCLAEGMDEPVHLQFAIEPIVYQFRKGSRLRLTITCADTHTYQHPMYEEGLPTITLYQGGEHASFISVPFVEHEENVYNGTVTTESYTGPGTLYFFEKHVYLYANGTWRKLAVADGEADYTVKGYDAVFSRAGFTFRMEGKPVRDGILQHYEGGQTTEQPLPAFRHLFLDQVPVKPSGHSLFVPTVKTLKMDVFDGGGEAGRPCVVSIHGYGSSYSILQEQQKLLYDHGYIVVGIDLRNYPSNPFPDYLMDVKGAIRYVRAHADELGIDPNRIGCYGLSLGGNSTLMAAVTGENAELEGNVGGNPGVSSRLQAAVAGFAWSDLLYMGADILEEYRDEPEMQEQKRARTDGAFAPCAEAIDFAGKDRGIGVLRHYLEEGLEGTDPDLDQKLAQARQASPVNHIGPDCPPIALFGGYGARQVDIAMNQTLRSFRRFHEYDVTCFLFANTQGNYGRKPEVLHAVLDFLDHYLRDGGADRKLVLRRNGGVMIVNGLPEEEETRVLRRDGALYLDTLFLHELFDTEVSADLIENERSYVRLDAHAALSGITVRDFPDRGMMTLTKQ